MKFRKRPATSAPSPTPPAAFVPSDPSVTVPYSPGGAYGDEGPSTLDRDARLVRPNDPYAPKPRAAPAVPPMPLVKAAVAEPVTAPATTRPAHNAFTAPQGPFGTSQAPYGVGLTPQSNVPPAPAPPGPARKGSVAPPGLG